MGLFDWISNRAAAPKANNDLKALNTYFQMMTAYSPAFTTYQGGLYEMDLTRAAVHAYAKHCGKLKAKVVGAPRPELERILQKTPNQYMDAYSYQYKLASILKVENNAFIVPLFDDRMRVVGYWPVRPCGTSIKVVEGVPYLVYESMYGKVSIEYRMVGHLRNHFYRDDIYGESNRAIDTTLRLMHTQNEGIINAIKSSANIRFLARMAQTFMPKDLEEERTKFNETNLSSKNNGGVMIFDNKYADVKQVDSQAYLVNPRQAELIRQNVYSYFGVNDNILQNDFSEDGWNAYYEGEIEPFAIQLSLVKTAMNYSPREMSFGNEIIYEASRLQYASNTTKLSAVTQLFDRGMMTTNQGLEVFNMAGIGAEGDKRYIRKEYAEFGTEITNENPQVDPATNPVSDAPDGAEESSLEPESPGPQP